MTSLAQTNRWQIHPVGAMEALPERTKLVLAQAQSETKNVSGLLVGRQSLKAKDFNEIIKLVDKI